MCSTVCQLIGAVGAIARQNHRFERTIFMRHVAFRGFDQIWDQVVAAGQLHVDLRKSVADAISAGNQAVVNRHHP